MKHKIVLSISGASGSIYAKLLLDKFLQLYNQIEKVGVVMSENAKYVWNSELGSHSYKEYPFDFYEKQDFEAPFASGSAHYNAMVVAPCSMGTLSRIAHGTSNDLSTRAADVMLKERRRLILLCRESPLSKIHLKNMLLATEAGAIICPASPSFYSRPTTIDEVAHTIIDRVVDLIGLENNSFRWGETKR